MITGGVMGTSAWGSEVFIKSITSKASEASIRIVMGLSHGIFMGSAVALGSLIKTGEIHWEYVAIGVTAGFTMGLILSENIIIGLKNRSQTMGQRYNTFNEKLTHPTYGLGTILKGSSFSSMSWATGDVMSEFFSITFYPLIVGDIWYIGLESPYSKIKTK